MATQEEILATPLDGKPTTRDRLAAARARQAARDEKLAAEAEVAELERFDLVERFEKELGGREGSAFAIVNATDLGEGHIVLRLGEGILWKVFSASKVNDVDVDNFVVPCVMHPAKETYREIVARRGAVAARCAAALSGLFGLKMGDDQKK